MDEIKKLRKTIFNMLNYANMYVLVLDEKLTIKFCNNSLAKDLGFESEREVMGRCWLDFIDDKERKTIVTVHSILANGMDSENKYKEFINNIVCKNGECILVHWFNSYINSNFNWTFSFGIRKKPVTEITADSIRQYYRDIIDKDRTMIHSMRDMILFKDRVLDSCEPKNLEV